MNMRTNIVEDVKRLVEASGIKTKDSLEGSALYAVCESAIRDGEGTPQRVREIWQEAEEEWGAERAYQEERP